MAFVEAEIPPGIAVLQDSLHLLIVDQLVIALRGRQIDLAYALSPGGAADQAGDDRQTGQDRCPQTCPPLPSPPCFPSILLHPALRASCFPPQPYLQYPRLPHRPSARLAQMPPHWSSGIPADSASHVRPSPTGHPSRRAKCSPIGAPGTSADSGPHVRPSPTGSSAAIQMMSRYSPSMRTSSLRQASFTNPAFS